MGQWGMSAALWPVEGFHEASSNGISEACGYVDERQQDGLGEAAEGGMGDAKVVYGRNRVFREMGGHQSHFIQEGSVLTVNNLRCTSAGGVRDVIWLRSCVDSLEFLMLPSMRMRVFPRSVYVRVVIPRVGHGRTITNNRNV